jgi:predicted GNAT family acetyltransferase
VTDYEITHNEAESRFETTVDGHTARLLYRMADGRIIFISTQVPSEIESRGIGSALARTGLEYARDNSLTVTPICTFVRAYIDRNPEYQSLLG